MKKLTLILTISLFVFTSNIFSVDDETIRRLNQLIDHGINIVDGNDPLTFRDSLNRKCILATGSIKLLFKTILTNLIEGNTIIIEDPNIVNVSGIALMSRKNVPDNAAVRILWGKGGGPRISRIIPVFYHKHPKLTILLLAIGPFLIGESLEVLAYREKQAALNYIKSMNDQNELFEQLYQQYLETEKEIQREEKNNNFDVVIKLKEKQNTILKAITIFYKAKHSFWQRLKNIFRPHSSSKISSLKDKNSYTLN